MPKFRTSKSARKDLAAIAKFTIERWGAEQADRYLHELDRLFNLLVEQPMMGRLTAEIAPDLRRIEHGSHVIFYRVSTRGLRIERVLHKHQAMVGEKFRD